MDSAKSPCRSGVSEISNCHDFIKSRSTRQSYRQRIDFIPFAILFFSLSNHSCEHSTNAVASKRWILIATGSSPAAFSFRPLPYNLVKTIINITCNLALSDSRLTKYDPASKPCSKGVSKKLFLYKLLLPPSSDIAGYWTHQQDRRLPCPHSRYYPEKKVSLDDFIGKWRIQLKELGFL